ncbi:unnamed protein product [Paramecium pentaurelia]|uniref:Uncharacterized protein n=1 Tax=Paramecium pentaurelia TaxID=43138 RepID=A0A8S1WX25_9CILI|nr:unnamed protein product [Paramecium pentaurelia]
MSSTIVNKMEEAMNYLYQILASQSEVQLPKNYNQQTNICSTIIVFQRYVSNTQTIFLYGYDSNSLIIIKQQHYKLDEFIVNVPQYFIRVQQFLSSILIQYQQVCIHFINYASLNECDSIQIKQEAYNLLEVPYPQSKIIVWIEYQKNLQFPNDCLQIKFPDNQLALLKIQSNLIKNYEMYEEFTIKQITQIQGIHKQFKQKIELCEKQVVTFNFLNLIKSITLLQDMPDQIQYQAQLLMNLPSYTGQDVMIMIAKLKLYKQNAILSKVINQQNLKINEYLQVAKTDLNLFKDQKNHHFPKKGENSQKCKVCQKNSNKVRKSSYICEACQKYYLIKVTLCTTRCFKVFHLNPEKYLRRKNRIKKIKVEE